MENGTEELSDIAYLNLDEELSGLEPAPPPISSGSWLPAGIMAALGLMMMAFSVIALDMLMPESAARASYKLIGAFAGIGICVPLMLKLSGFIEHGPGPSFESLLALLPGSLWRVWREKETRIEQLRREIEFFNRAAAAFEVRESFGRIGASSPEAESLMRHRAMLEDAVNELIVAMNRALDLDDRRASFLEMLSSAPYHGEHQEAVSLIREGLLAGCREFGLDYARLTKRLSFLA